MVDGVVHSMPVELIEVARTTKYPLDAFLFVERGLRYTVNRIHGEAEAKSEAEHAKRHVTGRELCLGLRDYAIEQYGPLARTVLRRWRVNASEDFGRMVFAMVEAKHMQKTDRDTIRDFTGVFDFDEAFTPAVQIVE